MVRYSGPRFCPELLEQYLIDQGYDQLLACRLVCWAWKEESDRLLYEVLDLNHSQQYQAFCNNTDLRRRPKRVIATDFCERQEFYLLPGLQAVHHFEISFMSYTRPGLLSTAIQSLSGTLRTIVLHDTLLLSYSSFIDVLKALHLCKGLRQLSIPPPMAVGDYEEMAGGPHPGAAAEGLAGQITGTGVFPVLTFLQIVSRNDRHKPRKVNGVDSEWLSTPGFPFRVDQVDTLVIGSPAAARYLLPRVSSNLVSLEYCVFLDWCACWTDFRKCRCVCIP